MALAWTSPGTVRRDICRQTGLSGDCRVLTGIHDSNASFSRYAIACDDEAFTVLTTGTWSVAMACGVSLEVLMAGRDMLANVDFRGRPIACARSMGGREYEAICRSTGDTVDAPEDAASLQLVIDAGTVALPDYSGGSGPFAGRAGRIMGTVPAGGGPALASLYCALMLDYQMDLLSARGDIFVEGAFVKNKLLCGVLAQLRPQQTLWLSSDTTGTVAGCLSWFATAAPATEPRCSATRRQHSAISRRTRRSGGVWRTRDAGDSRIGTSV